MLTLLFYCFQQPTVEYFVYKDHIAVDDLGITAKEEDHHKFTIWYKKRNLKSYKLETSDTTIRETWVEDITSLLWEQAMQKKGIKQMYYNFFDTLYIIPFLIQKVPGWP